ncbi:LEAF RUST 10 DISEASE-RESISTANCE LOCUS RECEPTOR-LIKE PROTEIN KINASE-like protein 1.2 [Cinnamomum micranthum f. kanehirae]|uniref:non-specific serine/threonine protein kinase n=1 Tax=Cinnamomum micranthum f. kanehirae TaxID=337451 RepID=A0A3S3MP20_9MAGN|nr:LEAF RUST 10 DISEASE-RESISTANCE LOCUS RECEPTOR-LIKE PROTEIN KINASE-like protein 1.2 [Cinnamomum micranthum f. kanehirae]
MHSHLLFTSLFLIIFLTISLSQGDSNEGNQTCAPSKFDCGSFRNITYPFWVEDRPLNCSYPGFNLTCNNNSPEIKIGSKTFQVKAIDYGNQVVTLVDTDVIGKECPPLASSWSLDFSLFAYTPNDYNLTIYNCPHGGQDPFLHVLPCLSNGSNYSYYKVDRSPSPIMLDPYVYGICAVSVFTILNSWVANIGENLTHFGGAVEDGFNVSWVVDSGKCWGCVTSGGNCGHNPNQPDQPVCYCSGKAYQGPCPLPSTSSNKDNHRKVIIKTTIGICAATGSCLITAAIAYLCYRKKRLTSSSSKLISRTISSDPSSRSELGHCHSILPTHVFSYKELEEATNNFDPSRELGEGGFGTVYHGNLLDGRSVAVKRLYEHNFRRVEQFKNEIEIISRLRHRNLVSLYGCTSRHSRELLLVYEFVPNGTVADHLHGERAKAGALTWPIRMSIAIETADALAYLHAVDIIHRDVKTNNILLDNNFQVKVADFGLSRLFPMDRTHVSTAPQGTPGYVDPDYHRCYQLNDKSDVYSFGVVLFELISSKPAVDITRHRHDINLANMAINKIHSNALHELVDPSFEFESNSEVRRRITLVAELAYRCLHDEKEMRPSMEEVLVVLREVESDKYKADKGEDIDVPADDVVLLKKKMTPSSPDSVTAPWISRNTTPNTSGSG